MSEISNDLSTRFESTYITNDEECDCYNATYLNCNLALDVLHQHTLAMKPFGIALATTAAIWAVLGIGVNTTFCIIEILMLRRRLLPCKSHILMTILAMTQIWICVFLAYKAVTTFRMIQEGEYLGIWYQNSHESHAIFFLAAIYEAPLVIYCAMCLLQMFAIKRPLQYHTMEAGRYSMIVIVSILSVLGFSAVNAVLTVKMRTFDSPVCFPQPALLCRNFGWGAIKNALLFDASLYVVGFLIMDTCYGCLFYSVQKRKHHIRKSKRQSATSSYLGTKNKASTNSESTLTSQQHSVSIGGNSKKGYSLVSSTKSAKPKKKKIHDKHCPRRFLKSLAPNIFIFTASVFVDAVVRIVLSVETMTVTHRMHEIIDPLLVIGSINSIGENTTISENMNSLMCGALVEKEIMLADSLMRIQKIMVFCAALSGSRIVLEPLFHMYFNCTIKDFILHDLLKTSKWAKNNSNNSDHSTSTVSSPTEKRTMLI